MKELPNKHNQTDFLEISKQSTNITQQADADQQDGQLEINKMSAWS